MEYLNPEDPNDLKIILDDQIDMMLEQISTTELFELLREHQDLKSINNITQNELVFILKPESQINQESVYYLHSFLQQIYFDFFNH